MIVWISKHHRAPQQSRNPAGKEMKSIKDQNNQKAKEGNQLQRHKAWKKWKMLCGKEVPGWPLLCILRVPVGESGKQGYSGWIWPGYSKALKMVVKLVKQYWEEHDAEISIRSKEGHLVQGQGWNTGKRNRSSEEKTLKVTENKHCQTDLPAAMKCPLPVLFRTAVW